MDSVGLGLGWVLAILVVVSAGWVVTLRNMFRAALSLGLVLLGVAGLFLLLQAEFIAFVQILVYVGAILTLVVFAIMLTARLDGGQAPASRQPGPAAGVSLALFALLVATTRAIHPTTGAPPVSLPTLGQEMVKTLVLPFEVISLVFVAAVFGAVAIATVSRRSSSETK